MSHGGRAVSAQPSVTTGKWRQRIPTKYLLWDSGSDLIYGCGSEQTAFETLDTTKSQQVCISSDFYKP